MDFLMKVMLTIALSIGLAWGVRQYQTAFMAATDEQLPEVAIMHKTLRQRDRAKLQTLNSHASYRHVHRAFSKLQNP